EDVVKRLRKLKNRPYKPFAIMVKNIDVACKLCYIDELAKKILLSPAAPIVILTCKDSEVLDLVSPGLKEIGIMLPYTPLHNMLFDEGLDYLIMTSGNLADEPICIDNKSALNLPVDGWLLHNRDIENRVDDSVVRIGSIPILIRRSRGFVQEPIELGIDCKTCILGVGAELKNTITIATNKYAYVSQHIGDLSEAKVFEFFVEVYNKIKKLLDIEPEYIAHDMHPDYISTIWSKASNKKLIEVQHHHAHIASVLAEHKLDKKVIGVAFDGSGYGLDGSIWGGEFLIVDGLNFKRVAHIKPFKLIGGEKAIKEIWRCAFAIAAEIDQSFALSLIPENYLKYSDVFFKLIENEKILTSSMGRLFDAVATISGVRNYATYEAQAASELEAICEKVEYGLRFLVNKENGVYVIDPTPFFKEIIYNGSRYTSKKISSLFHGACIDMICDVVNKVAMESRVFDVVLSGGCFQNKILLENAIIKLKSFGYRVYINQKLPPNDANISLGQVWVALKGLKDVSCC
ncbi:MAG: carbamoyltransferase HypF, partial [bacterium]|nr:carbamoyltransferase HypF [bacterium]